MLDCELCDRPSTNWDRDLDMVMCHECFQSFNPTIVDIELNEVW